MYEAWKKVRANDGAPGVDAVSIAEFASEERDNLYKLWNRMSSGSYVPGPVRAVEIPKDHGAGIRTLGVPNTADRYNALHYNYLLGMSHTGLDRKRPTDSVSLTSKPRTF